MLSNKNNYLYFFLIISIIVIAIAIGYSYSIDYLYGNKVNGASVGDSYGALNAIFSGLAFSGVILTVIMQKDELKLQREELQETRKEFQMSRATNVIYNQLKKFDSEMSNFEFIDSDGDIIEKGTKGILELNKVIAIKPTKNGAIILGMDAGRRNWLIRQIRPLITNRNTLLILTAGLKLSLKIVNDICSDDSFNEIEKIKLKSLFYRNISSLHTYTFEGIIKQIEEFKAKIYEHNDHHVWKFTQGEFNYLLKSTDCFKLLLDNLDEIIDKEKG
ncbi:hypothetical protein D9V96_008320 [Zobellia laminariae]|uniref:hypothetical protein n=1 Tax=Zobellia laminariae TaxID=248906 RepID=UPI0012D8ECA3|nr:hypothetical protein [Zobellia laminariae]